MPEPRVVREAEGEAVMPAYRFRFLSDATWRAIRAEHKRRTNGEPLGMEEVERLIAEHIKKHGAGTDGPVGILHGDLGPACLDCNGVSDVLCDFPVGRRKTCDRAICEECSPPLAPNLHYCAAHRVEWEEFKSTELRGMLFVQFGPPVTRKRRKGRSNGT